LAAQTAASAITETEESDDFTTEEIEVISENVSHETTHNAVPMESNEDDEDEDF